MLNVWRQMVHVLDSGCHKLGIASLSPRFPFLFKPFRSQTSPWITYRSTAQHFSVVAAHMPSLPKKRKASVPNVLLSTMVALSNNARPWVSFKTWWVRCVTSPKAKLNGSSFWRTSSFLVRKNTWSTELSPLQASLRVAVPLLKTMQERRFWNLHTLW